MNKNLKKRKSTLFFITVFFLLSIAGVSTAQLRDTSLNTTSFSKTEVDTNTKTEVDTNTTDSAVDLNNELNDTENSTEDLNNKLNNTENSTEQASNEPDTINDTAIPSEYSKTETQTIKKLDVQSEELLKILREKDRKKIEELKRRKLEGVRERKILDTSEDEKNTTDGVVDNTEGDNNLNDETSVDTVNTEEESKDLNSLNEVEKNTTKEVGRTDKIVFEKKKIIERIKIKKGREDALLDSDQDGISNFDEVNIYKTDPSLADSDGDGYIDGAEVLSGFNPNDPSLEAVVKYEDPKNTGEVDNSLFAVSAIDIEPTEANKKEISKNISVKGKSIPNAFITLYIYSDPTIVTVKTDKDGNWNYTLDKELENGDHEIYVAITDNTGSIVAKSNPIPFVKQAAAVTVDQTLLSFDISGDKVGFFNGGYLYMTILLVIFFTGVVLVIVGLRARSKEINSS